MSGINQCRRLRRRNRSTKRSKSESSIPLAEPLCSQSIRQCIKIDIARSLQRFFDSKWTTSQYRVRCELVPLTVNPTARCICAILEKMSIALNRFIFAQDTFCDRGKIDKWLDKRTRWICSFDRTIDVGGFTRHRSASAKLLILRQRSRCGRQDFTCCNINDHSSCRQCFADAQRIAMRMP